MFDRFKLGLVAVIFVVSAFLGLAARAEDEKKAAGCGYCNAVAHVGKAMRCEGCKAAEKACDPCAEAIKKMTNAAKCKSCGDKHADAAKPAGCADCAARMPKDKGHCEFCADKKMVADNTWCCGKCSAANKADCGKCQEMRKTVMAVKCAMCKDGK